MIYSFFRNKPRLSWRGIVGSFILLLSPLGAEGQNEVIDLRGNWAFSFDAKGEGIFSRWFDSALQQDSIPLPGTTETAKKGTRNRRTELKHLTRVYPYSGKAWYQKTIEIPRNWKGKHVTLFLERTKTTTVWLDTVCLGSQNSLTTAHIYDLSSLLETRTSGITTGKHRLTICVDNKELPPVGDPHQLSDQTQTNWNGIIGKIELRKTEEVWLSDMKIVPDVEHHKATLYVKLDGLEKKLPKGILTVEGSSFNTSEYRQIPHQEYQVTPLKGEWQMVEVNVPQAVLWDEFHPALYKMSVAFKADVRSKVDVRAKSDARFKVLACNTIEFGMREFTTKGTQFCINGKTIFLRGKHDACVFPLTGFAPMNVEGWVKVLRIAKSYGINHYRFHTWCPPEAAFKAADLVGIYMQPELPVWGSIGRGAKLRKGDVEQHIDNDPVQQRIDYLRKEGLDILKSYAHYPSFVMMALGNEMGGSMESMADLIKSYRQYDSTKLYAQGSNNFLSSPRQAKGDDYWTTTMTGGHYDTGKYEADTDGKEVRGSYPVHTKGHVNNKDCGTLYDYSSALKGITVPVIGHEVGQYEVFPNFKEIKKYTGVTRARNFETFRDRLGKAGMLDEADDFFKASGAQAVNCYREDIEAALRTPGFGGFQLLDLQDFPGQGTALVGILDAFMDSKGLISPADWRNFCSDVVPLARMKNRIWKNTDKFTVQISVAHYGDKDLVEACQWMLRNERGDVIVKGELNKQLIRQGGLRNLGEISFSLAPVVGNQHLTLSLQIGKYHNDYPLWIYDQWQHKALLRKKKDKKMMVATEWNEKVIKALERGKNVLLVADTAHLQKTIDGAFITDFWCYPMFKKYGPPGTMGLLIQSSHRMFQNFPTASHSDWQWWRITKQSPVMNLGKLPAGLRPVVQVIDNFATNRHLSLLFEAKVGKGHLVVSSIALLNSPYPEVEALRESIMDYMRRGQFSTDMSLSIDELSQLFK